MGPARFRAAPLWTSLLALAGCMTVTPTDCGTGRDVASLQCRAEQGNKGAQLELGIAYETGAGVAPDLALAARFYKQAATPTSGTTYVYSPGVGQAPAQVLPIRTGPDQPGLNEAMLRLARLYELGLGVRRDPAKAARWRARAGQ